MNIFRTHSIHITAYILCLVSLTSRLTHYRVTRHPVIAATRHSSVSVKDENVKKALREMEHLTEDVHTLSQMVDLVTTLHCPRGLIEENLRDMLSAINKQLTEKHVNESQLSHLELNINTRYVYTEA